jgi:rSAM/selenodomain-associated transferase 2
MIRLAIVIPTLNAAAMLHATLDPVLAARALAPPVLVVDGGSRDATVAVARERGVAVIEAPRGRGSQLAAGAAAAEGDWLLFLHADTRLPRGWDDLVASFAADPANRERAGVFALRFDDDGRAARITETIAAWRSRWFGLPYGDQGLLIARELYEALGGFAALPIMEDVDLVRRIGRSRLVTLPAHVVTSAARYRRSGYAARMLRNLVCLILYFCGVAPRRIARLYG